MYDALTEKVARALANEDRIDINNDALYRFSTYGLKARAALAIAMPAAFEMAAEVAEKRAEARFADFGTTEPDTNASYYSGRRGETLDELVEEDWHIAQTIRAEGEKWK